MGIGNVLVLSQVTGYVLTFLLAFFVFIPLAVNKKDFDNHCLLYSHGEWHVDNKTNEMKFDVTEWGEIGSCNFPLFVSVATLPVTLAYCALLSVDLFKNTEPSWLSAFLCLVVSLMGWFLCLIAASTVSVGYGKWCDFITEKIKTCSMAQYANIEAPDGINIKHFADQMGITKFGLWSSFVCWSALSVFAAIQLFKYHQNESFLVSVRRERERLIQRTQTPRTV